jgi:hypothetical protein
MLITNGLTFHRRGFVPKMSHRFSLRLGIRIDSLKKLFY